MKAVLISIQPKWVEKMASGKKTIELRKSIPVCDTPFKCYIYVTRPKKWFKFSSVGYASDESLWLSNGKVKMCDGFEFWASGGEYECLNGKVIGEFVCDRIDKIGWFSSPNKVDWKDNYNEETCLTNRETYEYSKGGLFYEWHITDLKIYEKPKELSEFYARCNIPESRCKLCDNCYDREDYYGRHYAVKKITRPPQSWQYCEVEE